MRCPFAVFFFLQLQLFADSGHCASNGPLPLLLPLLIPFAFLFALAVKKPFAATRSQ
jgi:hypothetical protein